MSIGFSYRDAVGTAGVGGGGALVLNDYHAPCSMVAAYGNLLLLNGINRNRKIVDGLYTLAAWPLIGTAPYGYLSPTTTSLGTGRIYGLGYKWRYRFKAATTGEVTGMTDPSPTGTNLGAQTTPGAATVVGQNASFNIAGRTGDDGIYFNRIELIRNTSEQEDIWYVVKEVANPGLGSYVLITDDVQDEELITRDLAELKPNPSHNEGPLYPVAKAFTHPTGRTWYYGIIPMGTVSLGIASATQGNQYVTVTGDATPSGEPKIPRERVGQQFVPLKNSGGTDITATQTYRIVASATGAEGDPDIYPAWAEGTLTDFSYEIRDDRDPRAIYQSEPAQPCQVDYLKTFFIGGSRDDPLYHVFAMGGVTYAITNRRIYRLDDDFTEDPSLSVRLTVVAEEGCAGLWACAETPIGLAFMNTARGVRIFNGQIVGPLGGAGPVDRFPIKDQFENIDPNLMTECRMFYDSDKHRIFLSYPPEGKRGLDECLVYDISSGCWRGPWRQHITAISTLIDQGGACRTVYGDEFGNVLTDEDGVRDILNLDTGQSSSGTIATIPGAFTFTASGTWDPSTDKRIVGCPIVITDGTNIDHNWIAGYDGTNFQLLNFPSYTIAVGNTFKIGAVRWNVTTAWLDAGEPIQPKTLENLRMRFDLGPAATPALAISAAHDGGTTFGVDSTDSTTTSVDVVGKVHSVGNLSRGGQNFSIKLTSTSDNGHPRITAAVADIKVGAGGART